MRIEPFRAARGGARANFAVMPYGPFDDPPEAQPGRHIHIYDGIGPRQAVFEGSGEVSVHNPLVAGGELFHGLGPVFGFRFLPAWEEVLLVEVDDGQAGPLRQLMGEGGFARAGAANYEDTLNRRNGRIFEGWNNRKITTTLLFATIKLPSFP